MDYFGFMDGAYTSTLSDDPGLLVFGGSWLTLYFAAWHELKTLVGKMHENFPCMQPGACVALVHAGSPHLIARRKQLLDLNPKTNLDSCTLFIITRLQIQLSQRPQLLIDSNLYQWIRQLNYQELHSDLGDSYLELI